MKPDKPGSGSREGTHDQSYVDKRADPSSWLAEGMLYPAAVLGACTWNLSISDTIGSSSHIADLALLAPLAIAVLRPLISTTTDRFDFSIGRRLSIAEALQRSLPLPVTLVKWWRRGDPGLHRAAVALWIVLGIAFMTLHSGNQIVAHNDGEELRLRSWTSWGWKVTEIQLRFDSKQGFWVDASTGRNPFFIDGPEY